MQITNPMQSMNDIKVIWEKYQGSEKFWVYSWKIFFFLPEISAYTKRMDIMSQIAVYLFWERVV